MAHPSERALTLADGALLHVYDTGRGEVPLLWHHGTPNTGAPPAPLLDAAERLGLRWFSWDRPGYGGSSPCPDRPVSSAARYAEEVADALGVERFAVMGHSGGGPHALACGALLADRVIAVVAVASLAPYGAPGLDWTAGMCASGVAALTSAAKGRAAKEAHEAAHGDEYDPEFTPADLAVLEGEWSWFGSVVAAAAPSGRAPAIDDDLAYVRPWGFDPADVRAPTLLLHGEQDRIVPAAHSRWLAAHLPHAELRLGAQDGHVSVVRGAESALEWVAERSAEG
ncbi:alpha/beta fold hydrolase [Actinotalea sp.]|uniref:alpha/beta fold hydrolase n=1 Tax=Actinotalea sp. TaxID=1872145 RepID=UPI0035695187